MKFTNVSAIVALLSLGACVAVRTKAEVSTIAKAIVKGYETAGATIDTISIPDLTLTKKEKDALRAVTDKQNETLLIKALTDLAAEEELALAAELELTKTKNVASVKKALEDSDTVDKAILAIGSLAEVKLTEKQITALFENKGNTDIIDTQIKDVLYPVSPPESGTIFTVWNCGMGAAGLTIIGTIAYATYHFTHEKMDAETDL